MNKLFSFIVVLCMCASPCFLSVGCNGSDSDSDSDSISDLDLATTSDTVSATLSGTISYWTQKLSDAGYTASSGLYVRAIYYPAGGEKTHFSASKKGIIGSDGSFSIELYDINKSSLFDTNTSKELFYINLKNQTMFRLRVM